MIERAGLRASDVVLEIGYVLHRACHLGSFTLSTHPHDSKDQEQER